MNLIVTDLRVPVIFAAGFLLLVLDCSVVFSGAQRFGPFRDILPLTDTVEPNDPIRDNAVLLQEYDFVVVGAGSGGSVVTNRLSENPDWSVLLLEAGGREIFLTDVPLTAAMTSITRYNWGYKTEKMRTACLGVKEQRCNQARGKSLGGTSVINFLLYTRGNRLDFDEWESLGNAGWSYRDVLPYFIKSENISIDGQIDEEYHGRGGYLSVEHPPFKTPMVKQFIKAGQELGYENNDPNGKSALGFSEVQATMRGGRRCSAAKAFLTPIQDRPNVKIVTRARVTKVLIDPTTKTAYGVEVLKNRRRYEVRARKEVILSAGSFNSPQILMLSGVGPADHLRELNIPVLQNLPVGYNLQDHLAFSALGFLVNESITISDRGVQNPVHVFQYVAYGKGPFTIPGGAGALAFVKTKLNTRRDDYPDIELVLGSGALNGDTYGTLRYLLGYPDSVFDKVFRPVEYVPAFSIAPVLLRPKSRGRVMLKDSNPLHWPLLKLNYMDNEEDLKVLAQGIRMAIQVAETRSFQRFGTRLHDIPFPGCEHHQFNSDSYWECVLRGYATTLGHQVGTCKMGPATDPEAVVDPELKVHGIRGLRVVDGSIMPNIVAGHTNAVIFMIGEKASDMIKDSWKGR